MHWGIKCVHSDRRRWRVDPCLGDDAALAVVVELREILRDVLKPDCRAAGEYRRRIYVQHSDRSGLRSGPGLRPARPRSARPAEYGVHGESAGAYMVRDECVLRVRIYERAGRRKRGTI